MGDCFLIDAVPNRHSCWPFQSPMGASIHGTSLRFCSAFPRGRRLICSGSRRFSLMKSITSVEYLIRRPVVFVCFRFFVASEVHVLRSDLTWLVLEERRRLNQTACKQFENEMS